MEQASETIKEPLIVIALAGKARSGKDTISKYLAAHHEFVRIGFADGIRATFGAASGPTWDLHKEVEASGKSLRWMMQTMGTECREDIEVPDHWINETSILIRYLSHYHPVKRNRFVITDMRYPREAEVLDRNLSRFDPSAYIEVWGVVRPDGPVIAESGHSSEVSLGGLEPHRWVRNVGTVAELYGRVGEIMGTILMDREKRATS